MSVVPRLTRGLGFTNAEVIGELRRENKELQNLVKLSEAKRADLLAELKATQTLARINKEMWADATREIKELKLALRPFGTPVFGPPERDSMEHLSDATLIFYNFGLAVSAGDIRRARKALAEGE